MSGSASRVYNFRNPANIEMFDRCLWMFDVLSLLLAGPVSLQFEDVAQKVMYTFYYKIYLMFIGKKCTSFAIKRKTENYKYRLI